MLPSIDGAWVECERDSQAHDAEEFEEDRRPILPLACLIPANCIAEDDLEKKQPRLADLKLADEVTRNAPGSTIVWGMSSMLSTRIPAAMV